MKLESTVYYMYDDSVWSKTKSTVTYWEVLTREPSRTGTRRYGNSVFRLHLYDSFHIEAFWNMLECMTPCRELVRYRSSRALQKKITFKNIGKIRWRRERGWELYIPGNGVEVLKRKLISAKQSGDATSHGGEEKRVTFYSHNLFKGL